MFSRITASLAFTIRFPAANTRRCAPTSVRCAYAIILCSCQAARRLAVELQRREADLLERQLEQQRHLLTRLDNPGLKAAEKQTLLAALRALQTAALSTRARLAAALQRETTRPAPPPMAHPAAHPRGAMRRPRPTDARDPAGHGDQPAAKLPAGLPQEVGDGAREWWMRRTGC